MNYWTAIFSERVSDRNIIDNFSSCIVVLLVVHPSVIFNIDWLSCCNEGVLYTDWFCGSISLSIMLWLITLHHWQAEGKTRQTDRQRGQTRQTDRLRGRQGRLTGRGADKADGRQRGRQGRLALSADRLVIFRRLRVCRLCIKVCPLAKCFHDFGGSHFRLD